LTKHANGFAAKIHVKTQQFFLFTNIKITEYHEDDTKLKEDNSDMR